MISHPDQVRLAAVVLETIVETDGAAGGTLYAALMGRIEFDDFQALIQMGEKSGFWTYNSHVVTPTEKGRATIAAYWRKVGRDEKTGMAMDVINKVSAKL